MDGGLLFSVIILLFVLFIFVVPPLLWQGLLKLHDPVPLYLPVMLSGLTVGMLAAIRKLRIISDDNAAAGTIVAFTLLLLLVDFAVIAPFPYFAKKIGDANPWMVFTLLAFAGAFLLFFMTAGEAYAGRPMPAFSAPLPLTGWVLDLATSAFGLQGIVYAFGSPVYEVLREIGLWLEALILAVAYYGVLSVLPKEGAAGG